MNTVPTTGATRKGARDMNDAATDDDGAVRSPATLDPGLAERLGRHARSTGAKEQRVLDEALRRHLNEAEANAEFREFASPQATVGVFDEEPAITPELDVLLADYCRLYGVDRHRKLDEMRQCLLTLARGGELFDDELAARMKRATAAGFPGAPVNLHLILAKLIKEGLVEISSSSRSRPSATRLSHCAIRMMGGRPRTGPRDKNQNPEEE